LAANCVGTHFGAGLIEIAALRALPRKDKRQRAILAPGRLRKWCAERSGDGGFPEDAARRALSEDCQSTWQHGYYTASAAFREC